MRLSRLEPALINSELLMQMQSSSLTCPLKIGLEDRSIQLQNYLDDHDSQGPFCTIQILHS